MEIVWASEQEKLEKVIVKLDMWTQENIDWSLTWRKLS